MTIHPFQTTRLLFTPLLIRALKTGDELGIAAELKGLNANTSAIKKDPPSFTKKDYAAVSLTAAVLVAARYSANLFSEHFTGPDEIMIELKNVT